MRNAFLTMVLVVSGIALGLLGALVVAAPGAFSGERFVPSGSLPLLTGAFYGLVIGYPVGSLLGICCMGGVLHSRGSVLMAALGHAAGAAAVFWFMRHLNGYFTSADITLIVLGMFLLLPPLLGSIGYLSFRKRVQSFRLS